jgi:L-aspartate oxidase
MEFVQFHPTTLDVAADPAPLLTEALRGEGAVLVDRHGARFMTGRHDDLELAPRDIVARAVYQSLQDGGRPALDARAAVGSRFPQRFPTVFALAAAHGLDPRRELLPVAPAAHYTMGGIAVDDWGRSSLQGLWAAGEAGSSGLHGANRLASNSLLEGVVLGRRAATDIERSLRADASFDPTTRLLTVPTRLGPSRSSSLSLDDTASDAVGTVREMLWRRAGVVRQASGLQAGLDELQGLVEAKPDSHAFENASTIARLVLRAALRRTESRGAHARSDHPNLDPMLRRRVLDRSEVAPTQPLSELVACAG